MRSKIIARGRITREIGKKRGYKAALILEDADIKALKKQNESVI